MQRGTVGIREAKANLSRLVSDAQSGSEWTITDRGRPVARLGPLKQDQRRPDPLQRLVSLGWLAPLPAGPRRRRRLPPALDLPGVDAQAMLQEDRNG
jgi:prevent-host-death family protein